MDWRFPPTVRVVKHERRKGAATHAPNSLCRVREKRQDARADRPKSEIPVMKIYNMDWTHSITFMVAVFSGLIAFSSRAANGVLPIDPGKPLDEVPAKEKTLALNLLSKL
jgi:hypothetical protein